jgi:hypothetical protein
VLLHTAVLGLCALQSNFDRGLAVIDKLKIVLGAILGVSLPKLFIDKYYNKIDIFVACLLSQEIYP